MGITLAHIPARAQTPQHGNSAFIMGCGASSQPDKQSPEQKPQPAPVIPKEEQISLGEAEKKDSDPKAETGLSKEEALKVGEANNFNAKEPVAMEFGNDQFKNRTPEEQEAAALKIQNKARGKQAVEEVEKKKAAVAADPSADSKGHAARTEDAEAYDAKLMAGKAGKTEGEAAPAAEEAPAVDMRGSAEEQEAAALRIQNEQRRKQAVEEVEKKKAAVAADPSADSKGHAARTEDAEAYDAKLMAGKAGNTEGEAAPAAEEAPAAE